MNHQVLQYALLLDYPDLCQTQWSYYNILINTAEPGGLQLQRGRQDQATEHTRMHASTFCQQKGNLVSANVLHLLLAPLSDITHRGC